MFVLPSSLLYKHKFFINKEFKNWLDTFEHIIVLILENFSFNNLLGYLYEDEVPKGKKFEGLQNGSFENPVPNRVSDYKKVLAIVQHLAKVYHKLIFWHRRMIHTF